MRRIGLAPIGMAVGLAVAAVTAAQAQSVIERRISNELVETVTTRNIDGTTSITRRPLAPGAVVTAPAPVVAAPLLPNPFDLVVVAPAPTTVETVETVEEATPAVVTREVVRPRATTRNTVMRTTAPARTSTVRTSERRLSAAARDSYAMAMTPAQRQVIYRTIVRERPLATREVVTREVVGAPLPITPAPAMRTIVTEPVAERATIGTTLARDVAIYDMPSSVITSVPAARQFGYVTVGDRVLLVDPATRVIVDDLNY